MYDECKVFDIVIYATKEQVEEIESEFDMGNDSVYSFERLLIKKGYKYKINRIR